MKTVWFSNLKGKEQEDFKENVLGSKKVLDKAIEIIYTLINSGEKPSIDDFDSPSWAYRQAFLAGRKSLYNEIKDVLTVDDSK